MKYEAVFTPIHKSYRVPAKDGYNGSQLARIIETRLAGREKPILTKQQDLEFVNGLNAAHVLYAANIYIMLQNGLDVEFQIVECPEK